MQIHHPRAALRADQSFREQLGTAGNWTRILLVYTSVFHMFICCDNAHADLCCSTEAGLTLLFMPTVRIKENQKKIKAKDQIVIGFSQ